MSAYYNEFHKPTAAWLRELIKRELIADGVVDTRSIKEVRQGDLHEYTQVHFFAGIGGWSRALRLAGWPDDKPVWTGSCPCQSFSTAGTMRGKADKRHLWPWFRDLIVGCRPSQVFGEQVANAIKFDWLDDVATELGEADYEVGAAVFPASYVGAPHLRERLYFVADSDYRPLSSTQLQPVGDCMDDGFWSDAVWEQYPDGKGRAVKPGVRTVADGVPGGVELLRGAGNAIVPSQAAEFIRAYLEIRE
jgi:DNA (cytosine-5)-methyltransferase 1